MANLMAPKRLEADDYSDLQAAKFTPGWQPVSIIQALTQSQANQHGHLEHITAKLSPHFKYPEKNIWNKPMPRSRVKNAMKKWYSKNVKLLLPPLPEKEWEAVKLQAQQGVWDSVVKRRSKVHTISDSECDARQALLSGPASGKTLKPYALGRPHRLTRRFMRRMMARVVLKHTPVPIFDEAKQSLVFRWEDGKRTRQTSVEPDAAQTAALFGN